MVQGRGLSEGLGMNGSRGGGGGAGVVGFQG